MSEKPEVNGQIISELALVLRAIRGVTNCIESAARETTVAVAKSQPPDDAIPAACWAIEHLLKDAGKLIGASVYD